MQVAAAEYTRTVLDQITQVDRDPSLVAVKETDVYRLRRGLCLPSAALPL